MALQLWIFRGWKGVLSAFVAKKEDIRVLFAEELAKIIESRRDQPQTTGMMTIVQPDTPDLAGKPTVKANWPE